MSVFDQDKTWTTRDGRVMKIRRMEPSHVKNLIAWLRRNADQIALTESLKIAMSSLVSAGSPQNDPSDGVFFAALEEEGRAHRMVENPHRWLENTPLMIELVRVDARNERRIAKAFR